MLTSNLYRLLLDDSENEDEVKKQFNLLLKEKESSMEEITMLLNDFKIEYTDENIAKYVDIMLYFQYDISDDFCDYIVLTYIVNKQFLDKICIFCPIVDVIQKLCKYDEKKLLSDDVLIYISQYIDIYDLNASNNTNITDAGIQNMPLTSLDASYNTNITDAGIQNMPLTSLNASNNTNITDAGIRHMPLTSLGASCNPNITYAGIQHMQLII